MESNKKMSTMSRIAASLSVIVLMVSLLYGNNVSAADFRVDKSLVRKYEGPVKLLKDAEETLKIMELLVHARRETGNRRWKYNIFYPSVEIETEAAYGPSLSARGTTSQPGPEFNLIGVVVGKLGSFAIFPDKAVKEGETIGEIKVVRVSLDGVLLETKDGVKEIVIR